MKKLAGYCIRKSFLTPVFFYIKRYIAILDKLFSLKTEWIKNDKEKISIFFLEIFFVYIEKLFIFAASHS